MTLKIDYDAEITTKIHGPETSKIGHVDRAGVISFYELTAVA